MNDDPYRMAHRLSDDATRFNREIRRSERLDWYRLVLRTALEGLAVVLIFLGFLIIWPVVLGGR